MAKRILISALDWGLGHTTRCIPIIRELQHLGHEIWFAGNEVSNALILGNFPQIKCLYLKGYQIKYAKKKRFFALKIITQIPKLLSAINHEKAWLKRLMATHHFDLIISDNRYGFRHAGVKSVILTHQVQILSGINKLIDQILLASHRFLLEKFDQTWIVDVPEAPGMAAKLSHPHILPSNAVYIGGLSQFPCSDAPEVSLGENHCLILLSGPEPMRTQLAKQLWEKCVQHENEHFVFVEGKADAIKPDNIPQNIEWYAQLPASLLSIKMKHASSLINRGGYTTLMDLQHYVIPAIFIPTPGQTEQAYLVKHFQEIGYPCIIKNENSVALLKDIANLKYLKKHEYVPKSLVLFKTILKNTLK